MNLKRGLERVVCLLKKGSASLKDRQESYWKYKQAKKVDKNKILIHEFASDGGGDKKVPNLEPSRAPEKRDVKLPKNYWNCSNKSLTYLRSLFFPKKLHPKPADIQQYVPPQYQRQLSHFQQPQQHRPGTCVGCRKPGYLRSQYE